VINNRKKMDKKNIMAIGAHPDDPEIFCGGTLAKYSARGDSVYMVYATDGTAGGFTENRAKLAKTRLEEGRAAGAVIAAEVFSLGLPDGELVYSLENRNKVIEIIRRVKPDVIITHPDYDHNSDHRITGMLVNDAVMHTVSRKIKTESSPLSAEVPIYYMETYMGVNFTPYEYVDITDFFSTKMEMFQQHKSQIDFLKKADPAAESGFPIAWMEITARFRGFQSQVKYAEGFRPRIMGGSLRTERLLP
jgi:LmbE family N-acetylglucosaminyl deacetylase